MGIGLGANSPIVLSLGRGNYEALIERHGQWVRYRRAIRCPCMDRGTGAPNTQCPICHGEGWVYNAQKSIQCFTTVMYKGGGDGIYIGADYSGDTLYRVYDSEGTIYSGARKEGEYILLNASLPNKGVYITVELTRPLITTKVVECTPIGEGFYNTPAPTARRTIDNYSYSVPYDIVGISSLKDTSGNTIPTKGIIYNASSFYIPPIDNSTLGGTSDPIDPGMSMPTPYTVPLIAEVSYTPPATFLVLQQGLSRSDIAQMEVAGGDAYITAPYGYDISEKDIITVLSGAYIKKAILVRGTLPYDILPSYSVDSIDNIVGDAPYTDYTLVLGNRILWGNNAPREGEHYSISYRVLPTYRIVRAIPQIRSSENQHMPRRAIVKLDDTYSPLTS